MMCGSYCGGYSGRNFLTAQEKVEKLREYKERLEKEGEGVEEAISRLKKAS